MNARSSFPFGGCFVFLFAIAAFGFLIIGAQTDPPSRQNPLYAEPDLATLGDSGTIQFVNGYANW